MNPLTALQDRVSSENLDPYDAALDALAEVTSLSQIYDLTGYVTGLVEQEFECMQCVQGCSECCSQLPLVTSAEWELIVDWTHDNLLVSDRKRIVERATALLSDYQSAMPSWMQLYEVDLDSEDSVDRVADIFDNESTTCPFLFEGRCSIYLVRPLVCRSYGRMMRTEEDSLYCQPILEKINAALAHGVEVELPIYGAFQETSYELNAGLDYFSLLPVWILGHRTKDGDISDLAVDLSRNRDWPVLETKWGFAEAFERQEQSSSNS